MVSAAATSDEGAVGMNAFWAERLASSSVIVGRAIERGDVAESTDANLVIETLIGPLWFRLLLTGEPIDNDFADRVAELVARGATATPVTADPHVGPAPPSAGFGEP